MSKQYSKKQELVSLCLINNTMRAELEELAEMAKDATEREIETEIVSILKHIGWLRSQISQDVTISDKGADKADIVLKLDGVNVILVEVKKHGQLQNADNQVNRYCRLLRPSPKLAVLTDGVRWVFYYVGQAGAISLQEARIPTEIANVVAILTGLNPTNLSGLLQSGMFQYLDIVEKGLQERSEDTQRHLRNFFTSTVKALLTPGEIIAESAPQTTASAQFPPTLTEKNLPNTIIQVPSQQNSDTLTEYNPFQPPPLGFMAHITANFAGNTVTKWSDLLRTAVKTALNSGRTAQDIRRITSINIQDGNITIKGYSHIPGTNVSIQGQSADQSWQNALKLAQSLECMIEASFRWTNDQRAAHPNADGIMRWLP